MAAKPKAKKPASPKPLTRGERNCLFIERFCFVPEGKHVGKRIILDPFQRRFILAIYDNKVPTELAILSVARKNAKTAIIACIVILHMIGPEAKVNSELMSGAMSRDQAAKVYNYCAKMVALNPELRKRIRLTPSQKMMTGLTMGTTYRAWSADAATAMGGSPVLAILDEMGQIRGPQSDFVDAVETSQGAHESPLEIIISTQAANDADLLSIKIDDALRGKDPHTVVHLYAADEDCDVMDEKAWKKANPGLGTIRSIADVRKLAKRAARMPSSENAFRNLVLNQRVSALSPFISKSTWESCGGKQAPISECEVLHGSLDLSGKFDLTCFVLYGWARGKWNIYVWFWTPAATLIARAKRDRAPYDVWVKKGLMRTTPGSSVDYEAVAKDMQEIVEGLPIVGIAFDRWRIEYLKKELEALGIDLPLIEWGQGFKDMTPAIDEIESQLLDGKVAHGGHPVLTMCAANAKIVKDPSGNRKLDKQKSTGRIDGIVAVAMAAGIAKRNTEKTESLDAFLAEPLVF
jgi:phage terminase large subunit-like protein